MSASETPDSRNAPEAMAATSGPTHRLEIDDAAVFAGGRQQSTRRYLVDGKPVANLDALPPSTQAEVKRMLAGDGKPGNAGTAAADGIPRVEINDLEIFDGDWRQSTRQYLVDGKPVANLDALPPAMQAEVKRMLAEDGKPGNTGPAMPRMSITSVEPAGRSGVSMKFVIAIVVVLALSFMLGKMLS
jgi:hypothetical protein